MPTPTLQRWDIFCRVIDNHGDAGVCWRLARDLASRGLQVRLFIDDPRPLEWMAPGGAPGVECRPWPETTILAGLDGMNAVDALGALADVVIEAFGCDPPAALVERMAASSRPPVWINLEYLSAEPYVERSHGLLSPQRNGLSKWFFYPGFTPRTGGLLRESALTASVDLADSKAWLANLGIEALPGERLVSLFCYDNPGVPALLAALAEEPTLLLLTPGPAQRQVVSAPASVRLAPLPWLSQPDYERLLGLCALNFVRGEDSLVRAIWAGAPFIWQAYPQHDGAHLAKLDAMLAQWQPPDQARDWWRYWNGAAPQAPERLDLRPHWSAAALEWRERLVQQDDLVSQLLAFAQDKAQGLSDRGR